MGEFPCKLGAFVAYLGRYQNRYHSYVTRANSDTAHPQNANELAHRIVFMNRRPGVPLTQIFQTRAGSAERDSSQPEGTLFEEILVKSLGYDPVPAFSDVAEVHIDRPRSVKDVAEIVEVWVRP